MSQTGRKLSIKILRWIVTIGLLIYVVYKTELFDADKRKQIILFIWSADILLLTLSILFTVVINLISAFKWYMLVKARNIPLGFIKSYFYYMAAKFFNLVLPTSVGGDLIRIHELGKQYNCYADAAASVFVERFTGMITLVIIAVITLFLNLSIFNAPHIIFSIIVLSLVLFIIGLLVINKRPLQFIKKKIGNKFGLLSSVFLKIESFQNVISYYSNNYKIIWIAFINSLVFYMAAVINVWVSALPFDPRIDFTGILIAVPMVMIIMNIPISIGGIGLMEFAYTFTFELVGYSPVLAISVALLMRLKTFVDAGIGGIIYMFISQDRSIAKQVKLKSK